jgi:hypothetical protein
VQIIMAVSAVVLSIREYNINIALKFVCLTAVTLLFLYWSNILTSVTL